MSDPLHTPAAPVPAGGASPVAEFNPPQIEAVSTLDGPVLVLAGAGTGKTRVLTARLARLLTEGRATPFQILAVTFTNKAAREVAERVSRLTGRPTEGWMLGTFHAICARILRRHAERVGLKPDFTILDIDDQLRLLKQILAAENVDDKRSPARAVHVAIERWKDKGLRPAQISEGEAQKSQLAGGRLKRIYELYQERLLTLNACDFGDLLLYNLVLLQQNPDVLETLQTQLRYILVDEYQDTNVAQYLWLRLLAQKHRNICCVGDDDQSIYGWRGAEVGNILRFEQDFPGAKVIRLEQNYRSTGHILAAASALIAHNRSRLGKTLWTAQDAGQKLKVRMLWDGEDEARFVGDEIESLQRQGASPSEIAVLVRAGFQTREFEERFINLGIPYRMIGGARFYERQEIRDALAYFRCVVNATDDLAFERIINVPKRGVGPQTLRQLHQAATSAGISLQAATLQLASGAELGPKLRASLGGLCQSIGRWRKSLEDMPHTELARIILDESGYTDMWQADRSPEAAGRLENLKELVTALGEFDSLRAFLEHVSLVMEASEDKNLPMVSLMTLHAAKGLEFDYIFLPGWEEEIFPSRRSLDENGEKGLEEERRLAYVGITRGKKRVTISHVASRRLFGNWNYAVPSRFVEELPDANIEREALASGGQAMSRQTMSHPQSYGGNGGHAGIYAGGRVASPIQQQKRIADPDYSQETQEHESDDGYRIGARVRHQQFGTGTVKSASGDRLEILFDRSGRKTIIARFVTPVGREGHDDG